MVLNDDAACIEEVQNLKLVTHQTAQTCHSKVNGEPVPPCGLSIIGFGVLGYIC